MLVSALSCIVLGLLLMLLTVWRASWRRLLEREAAFWRRLGLPENWGAPLRRFEESRAVVLAVSALLVLHLLLLLYAAGAHAYYAPRLHKKLPVPLQPPPAKRPPH